MTVLGTFRFILHLMIPDGLPPTRCILFYHSDHLISVHFDDPICCSVLHFLHYILTFWYHSVRCSRYTPLRYHLLFYVCSPFYITTTFYLHLTDDDDVPTSFWWSRYIPTDDYHHSLLFIVDISLHSFPMMFVVRTFGDHLFILYHSLIPRYIRDLTIHSLWYHHHLLFILHLHLHSTHFIVLLLFTILPIQYSFYIHSTMICLLLTLIRWYLIHSFIPCSFGIFHFICWWFLHSHCSFITTFRHRYRCIVDDLFSHRYVVVGVVTFCSFS